MKIIITLCLAVLIQMLPVSSHIQTFLPNFIALVLIFWMIYAPGVIGSFQIFLFGLTCDVIFGTVLGAHSLSLLITAYCVYRMLRPLRTWPIWQQFILIFAILLINHVTTLAINVLQGYEVQGVYVFILTPFMGLVFWPVIRNMFFGFIPRSVR
jgi:rod shape-determining protein MreD